TRWSTSSPCRPPCERPRDGRPRLTLLDALARLPAKDQAVIVLRPLPFRPARVPVAGPRGGGAVTPPGAPRRPDGPAGCRRAAGRNRAAAGTPPGTPPPPARPRGRRSAAPGST